MKNEFKEPLIKAFPYAKIAARSAYLCDFLRWFLRNYDDMRGKMDQAKENAAIYREWILSHEIEGAKTTVSDGNIRIEADFAVCEINFYELELLVVELRITGKANGETAFFLHFEMRDQEYARELFNEMLETFEELRNKKNVQVLLSCTSALTTGLMAEKLNEIAALLSVDFHFDAVPIPELYEKAPDYDIILLAPQVAYEGNRIRKVLENVLIVDIPARAFATYDAASILETVRREYNNHRIIKQKKCDKKTVSLPENNSRILTLAMLSLEKGKGKIICRYYKNGDVIREETIIRKPRNYLREICDILDTTRGRGESFDAIGITTPGEIWEGKLILSMWVSPDVNIVEYLQDRYKVPVVLKNNTQAGILGFHERHKHYKNAVLLSQSVGARFGGAGIIANGQLLEGSHDVAGEIKYILKRFYGLTIKETHGVEPDEELLTTEFYVRCLISIIDPEIILIRNSLIPDMQVLQELLLREIPIRNMPKLRKVNNDETLEYMLLGIMILCMKKISKEGQNA